MKMLSLFFPFHYISFSSENQEIRASVRLTGSRGWAVILRLTPRGDVRPPDDLGQGVFCLALPLPAECTAVCDLVLIAL